jgi:hypothetical protein
MQRIYHVMIKGRTLESRDLKELLARAVNEKKNSDRKSLHPFQPYRQTIENIGDACSSARSAAIM